MTEEEFQELKNQVEIGDPVKDICSEEDLIDYIFDLRSRLPEGMEHCKILFKKCGRGHGRLVAYNWIDKGCPYCEIERLKK